MTKGCERTDCSCVRWAGILVSTEKIKATWAQIWQTLTVKVDGVSIEWVIRNITRVDDNDSKIWIEFPLPQNCKNKAA